MHPLCCLTGRHLCLWALGGCIITNITIFQGRGVRWYPRASQSQGRMFSEFLFNFPPFQLVLSKHGHNVRALHHLAPEEGEVLHEEPQGPLEDFQIKELFERPVVHPTLVILVLMVVTQFSGHSALTFYTAQIFEVRSAG